jgi:membrane glycosyltransferase
MPGFEAEIASIIQLAVAPVFLIAGIGGILNVLLTRLKLIYQRYRRFEQAFIDDPQRTASSEERLELKLLDRRMSLIHRSIALSTLAVLLVCIVIVALFTEEFIQYDVSVLVAALFVATMATLIVALIFFLVEIRIAMRMLRVRKDLLASR